ncbi:dihydropteroate synthase [Aliifodinibius sp. S!AR15-10]|uniref:dihydropteroate synthase n=1 Tax=Aliifodinibius sp. S!AR15-10 TaxID=2950437 RepID=UPI002862F7CF|nr:dihydropteroate synthase [Aliifodinibius sp. S!AR15-10]MDR8393000.1 dihydropteroate synthase [Aliifodinibius sp. S!AR15-10]
MGYSLQTEADQLRCRDKMLDLSTPVIMGVLNATPDSFSDGGKFNQLDSALKQISLMVEEGASIIDVGGESTRPGADPVSDEEELNRVMPILERAIPQFPETIFSIDTTKYKVAQKALDSGAHIINDISGLQKEPRLADLCAEYDAGYILMHSQGDPQTMQDDPSYDDVIADVHRFFEKQAALAKGKGVESILLDPGIGFGKTLEHNLAILANLEKFSDLGYPLLVGASRKSMLSPILNDREVEGRLIGTVAIHYHAMMKGAKIIRVHDVHEANDSVLVYNALAGY